MDPPSSPSNSNKAFDTYYREFAALLQQLENSHHDATASKTSLHQQCSDLLRLMSLEARSTDCPDTKLERLERVKIYKFQLEAVRQQHDAEFLMGDKAATMLDVERDRQQVRDRLACTEMRAAQQNELLERARRSVEETESIGAELLSELHRNRDTIQSAHDNVHSLSSMTQRASKIVKNMSRPWWLRR